MSTYSNFAIFISISSGGCVVFEHHLEILNGSIPNYFANYLAVLFYLSTVNKSLSNNSTVAIASPIAV